MLPTLPGGGPLNTPDIMAGLTSDAIDQLGDIWEGFSLMEEHGVSRDGCDSLEDMKERLRLHLLKTIGQGKTIDAVSGFFV